MEERIKIVTGSSRLTWKIFRLIKLIMIVDLFISFGAAYVFYSSNGYYA